MGYIYTIKYQDKPIYVGQTSKNPELRWKEHRTVAHGEKGFKIHSFMREVGVDNCSFEVLEETEQLNERENYWIRVLNTHESQGGCNLTWGGYHGVDSLKKRCYQYSIDGKYLQAFESVAEASEAVNGNHANILKVIYGQLNVAYGFRWSYDFYENLPKITNNYTGSPKKVGQYDLNGKFIQSFTSTKEAARALCKNQGNISSAANGKRKTAYGYIWKFL